MKKISAAGYARYSTNNQTENSIAYQLHEISGYCANHDIELTHTFIDEAQSGTNTNRSGFQNMLKAARNKEFENIIIYDVSRGSRDIADWFYFRKQMQELGINVISCHQKLGDPLNPNDFLTEFISVGLGQHQVLETRQKSMDGADAAAKRGIFLGGTPPFGYKIENQEYKIVPSEARIVREAFQLYYEGYSYSYIMKNLKIASIVGRKGSHMTKNSLYYMFKNPRYAGVYVWNEYTYQIMRKYVGRKNNPRKITIEGAIPAIVDMKVWKGVQIRLESHKDTHYKTSPKRTFLLSGLIKCGLCGSNYVSHASKSKGHEYKYYVCANRYGKKNDPQGCKSNPIRVDELDKFVIDAVKECLIENTDFIALAEEIAQKYTAAAGGKIKTQNIENEKKELQSVKEKIHRGVNALLDGFDTPELREQIHNLKEREIFLEEYISNVQTRSTSINIKELAKILKNDVLNMEEEDEEKIKATIRNHVPYIVANGDGTFTIAVGYLLPDKKGNKKLHSVKEMELYNTWQGQ